MMLQSCSAVFVTSILSSVSFHRFLAHVELEKELFAAWNQVPWPCKGRSETTTGYVDGLSNQEKNYAKNFSSFIPSHIRKTAAVFLAINKAYYLITDAGIKKKKQWRMHLTVTATELKHLDCFQGFGQDTYFKIR